MQISNVKTLPTPVLNYKTDSNESLKPFLALYLFTNALLFMVSINQVKFAAIIPNTLLFSMIHRTWFLVVEI